MHFLAAINSVTFARDMETILPETNVLRSNAHFPSYIHIAKFPISKVLNHQHDRQCIVRFVVEFDLRNGNFGKVNDRKCALFIRTSIIGGIASMSQMSPAEIKRTQSREVCQPYCKLVKNSRLKKCIKQCL